MPGNRIQTGIDGLDKMLNGGFLEGDAVMVAGSAGTGKTTLALEYLFNGATKFGQNGVYVTFEQLPDQLYRDANSMNWDLRKLEEEERVRVVCTSPEILAASEGGNLLDDFINEVHARRIVIDSMSHLAMYVDVKDFRKETYRMIMYLKTKGLSSLLIYEAPQLLGQTSALTDTGTSFLVDCVLMLKPVEIESSMRKAMTVLKMRGSGHDKSLREYEITGEGIKVGAPFSQYEGIMTGSARRLTSTQEAVERFSQAFAGKAKKR
jgi:circadian clock protein KaiC